MDRAESAQLPLDFVPRARRTDPASSHRAAFDARRFAATHAGQIVRAVVAHPGLTAKQLAALGCLSVVQIDRRAIELERAEWILRWPAEDGGELALWPTARAKRWAGTEGA